MSTLPRSGATPLGRTAAPLRLAVALAACAAFIGACKKDDKANTFAPPPPPEVIVANPISRDVTAYLTYTGVIQASETVDLRARVQGFLTKINFQPGQRVNANDILFEIDKRQYAADVQKAEATLQAQEAALTGAENDARLARQLADQNAGPEIDAIIKAARRDVAIANVAEAKAALVEAKLNLDYCTVRAPIAGRISRNLVDVGNLVGRGEATLLAQIVQATPCYVPIDVSEADVLAVRRDKARSEGRESEPGQIKPGIWRPCELALADQTEFKVGGRVDYVEPQLNTETGTLRVRTRFENEDDTLLPGLFARVRFPMQTRVSVLVPEAALLSDQQGRYALVVNSENEVEVRRVQIGELDGEQRVVEDGLTIADRVVVLGVLKARPGAKVTPKTQAGPAQPTPTAKPSAPPAPAGR